MTSDTLQRVALGSTPCASAEPSSEAHLDLLKRCVVCPTLTPSCPTCPSGQICSLIPQSCDACEHTICISNPNPPPHAPSPNVGAISGGVIGGVAFAAAVVFVLWRFWIKKRRAQQEEEAEEWEEIEVAQHKSGQQFNATRQPAP